MSVVLLIVSLILFVSLVIIHELGHFLVARRNGVKVLEFGIGFPPRAWHKKTRDGYDLSINWLPLGGFVRLKGEHDTDEGKGTYGSANLWVKTKIMLAGVSMNLIAAFILFSVLALIGMPKLIDSQFSVKQNAKIVQNEVLITYIEPNSPAANAGLKADDQLIQIGGLNSNLVTVTDANNLPTLTKSFAGQQVRVVYKHAGKVNSSVVTLLSQSQVQKNLNNNTPKGYLGVEPISYTLTRYTWSAPIVALGMMKQLTVLTFKGLASVVASLYHGNTAKASSQVTGPVGIFFLLQNGSRLGFEFILIIIAVISLTLAIMNVLPIPALDGGRLFVTLITRMFRHPIKQKTEEWIHGLGFMVLMFLIVLITVGDVKKYF